MKALRHIKSGDIYPMNEHLSTHPDVEFVDLDENMQVIEPAAELLNAAVGDEVEAEEPHRIQRKKSATGGSK